MKTIENTNDYKYDDVCNGDFVDMDNETDAASSFNSLQTVQESIANSEIADSDQGSVRSHCVATWLETCRLLREAALKSTNKAASKMIGRRLGLRVPTEYKVGDDVLVLFPAIRPGRRRKQQYHRFITSVPGRVVAAQPDQYRYRVEFHHQWKSTTKWLSVTDITSPSLSLEKSTSKVSTMQDVALI